jgi:UDP-N-acetylmuramoyl-L-alanine---L-glutamate ligase
MKIEELKNKKVIILGAGKEGLDALRYLIKKLKNQSFGIADEKELKDFSKDIKGFLKTKKINVYFGKDYLKSLKDYEVIIVSPGISPKTFGTSLKKYHQLTTATQIFFDECNGKIIGITGTKGKSTTSSLLYSILKEGGIRAHLVGNIGKTALKALGSNRKDDVYVFELSSFQLNYLKASPDISVLLNIFPEHLNWHEKFSNYYKAKANILVNQTKDNYLIYNNKDEVINKIVKKGKAKKVPIVINKFVNDVYKKSNLLGSFHKLNISAAITVARLFNISDKTIIKSINSFKPLENRLEFIGKYKGINFYNDSISTIPQSAIVAIESFNKVETIILGGFDRGGIKYDELVKVILKSKIKNLIFFPTTGKKIWREIRKKSNRKFNVLFTEKMASAIKFSYENTKKGSVCLLSPAAPSFNQFKNFEERGKSFKKHVMKYGKNK